MTLNLLFKTRNFNFQLLCTLTYEVWTFLKLFKIWFDHLFSKVKTFLKLFLTNLIWSFVHWRNPPRCLRVCCARGKAVSSDLPVHCDAFSYIYGPKFVKHGRQFGRKWTHSTLKIKKAFNIHSYPIFIQLNDTFCSANRWDFVKCWNKEKFYWERTLIQWNSFFDLRFARKQNNNWNRRTPNKFYNVTILIYIK